MKQLLCKTVRRISREVLNTLPPAAPATDLVVSEILRRQPIESLNDSVTFVRNVLGCIEPLRCNMTVLKKPAPDAPNAAAFNGFVEVLAAALPPVTVQTALDFARIADRYAGQTETPTGGSHPFHVRRHFAISSSSGRKGRLLAAAVQAFTPRLVLELGSAYGVSGTFILSSLAALDGAETRKLVTVEGSEPQATFSRTLLQERFGDRVQCEFGMSYNAIPRLSQRLKDVDLYFHDAGHTYDDYVNDVNGMLSCMRSGSVLLLDDIRWDDRRYVSKPSRAYEGWQAIVAHPRVAAAAEIDHELGIALFR